MTLAPGFGMEPTEPTLHPAGGPPPPPPTDAHPPSPTEPVLGSRGQRLIAYILDGFLIAFAVGAVLIVLGVYFVARAK